MAKLHSKDNIEIISEKLPTKDEDPRVFKIRSHQIRHLAENFSNTH